MKTRAQGLTHAITEALEMLQTGRPSDAAETLSAALEAPTDDRAVRREARDAALEEVCHGLARDADAASASGDDDTAETLNGTHDWVLSLKAAPAARYIPEAEVLEALRAMATGRTIAKDPLKAVHDAAERLGVDLNAAPASVPTPSTARHWLNDVQECSNECPACNENRARGLNPDGTAPEGSR